MKLIKRIYEAICDFVSVKSTVAIIVTLMYLSNAQTCGLVGFVIASALWICVIGFRFAEKYINILKDISNNGGEGQ